MLDDEGIDLSPLLPIKDIEIRAAVSELCTVKMTLVLINSEVSPEVVEAYCRNPLTREFERVRYIEFDDHTYIRFGEQGLVEIDKKDG